MTDTKKAPTTTIGQRIKEVVMGLVEVIENAVAIPAPEPARVRVRVVRPQRRR